MKAYSLDLRERIVKVVAEGMSAEDAAEMFGVSAATVRRYVARQRETGSLAPGHSPGRPRLLPGAEEAALRTQLEVASAATLTEHQTEWQQMHGIRLSLATMCRAIARVGWTRKKRPSMPASKMPLRARPGGSMRQR